VVLSSLPGTDGENLGSEINANADNGNSAFSDNVSEGCSSDSGNCSKSDTLTPADSVNDTDTAEVEAILTPWNICGGFVAITAYAKSLGTVMPNHAMIYEFEIPQAIVGRLIGRYGTFVNKIKMTTGANIIVKRHHTSSTMKICAVEGMCSEIEEAIAMIRDRFPVKRFSYLTLEQVNHQKPTPPTASISFLPSNNKLSLVEGVVNDVTVSYAVSLDIIFLQQPTHPTYPAMSRLHHDMKCIYEQPGAPQLVRPFNTGVICVTRLRKDEWYRAEVVAVQDEKDQVTARLVDIGGYVQVPIDDLRQIRVDFVTIPFQATECRLAHVVPCNDEDGWSEEAINFFKVMTHGKVLQAQVVGYSSTDSSTLIYLYRLNANNTLTLINEELITHGYGHWINEVQQIIEPGVIYTECDDMGHNYVEWTEQSGGYYVQNSIQGNNPSYSVESDKEYTNWTDQSDEFVSPEGSQVAEQAVLSDNSDAIIDTLPGGGTEITMENENK